MAQVGPNHLVHIEQKTDIKTRGIHVERKFINLKLSTPLIIKSMNFFTLQLKDDMVYPKGVGKLLEKVEELWKVLDERQELVYNSALLQRQGELERRNKSRRLINAKPYLPLMFRSFVQEPGHKEGMEKERGKQQLEDSLTRRRKSSGLSFSNMDVETTMQFDDPRYHVFLKNTPYSTERDLNMLLQEYESDQISTLERGEDDIENCYQLMLNNEECWLDLSKRYAAVTCTLDLLHFDGDPIAPTT
eukprot:augustus_masked-scaffold_87-processed-gene-0.33-mRNA-1 protein AED:1.00 eAED:1.00 QI:0/0/0/0/1/1/6/0/245